MKTSIKSPRLRKLHEELAQGNASALELFYDEIMQNGTPLIEPILGRERFRLVTFLWIESLSRIEKTINNVVVLDGVAGEDFVSNQLGKIEGTDIWHKSFVVRSDTRTIYSFSINDPLLSEGDDNWAEHVAGHYTLDPLNPRSMHNDSILELPDALPEAWLKPQDTHRGTIDHFQMKSIILQNVRDIWVYLPAVRVEGKYPLVVFFDGKDYLDISTTTIIDNLISSNMIQPMICVFVGNVDAKSREMELMCNPEFNQFLVDEFMVWLRSKYDISHDPRDILVGGASAGGNAAVFAGYRHPEIFGNVFAQCAGFWWMQTEGYLIKDDEMNDDKEYGYLIRKFVESEKLPLTFHLSAGKYDTATMKLQFTNHLISNRHMRDVLEAKGYEISYFEYSGSHDWVGWRGVVPDILLHFNTLLNKT